MRKFCSLKFFVLTFALVAITLVTSFAPSRPAHAISVSGQQLALRTSAETVLLDGYNQNGVRIRKCFRLALDYQRQSDGYYYITGYWWRGYVFASYFKLTSICDWSVALASDTIYFQPLPTIDNWLRHVAPI